LRLRPKHHFLVHFPTAILQNGFCVGFNCLRYELKNSFFKRSAGVVCNFTNISKTLASRHQYNAFHSRLSKQFLRNTVLVGNKTSEHLPAGKVRFFAQLHEQLQADSLQNVVIATKISVASVTYRADTFFVYTFSASGYPVFGCVECFVNIPGSDVWYVVMREHKNLFFVFHFYAYEITAEHPITRCFVALERLIDYNELYRYDSFSGNKTLLIRMPYHIFPDEHMMNAD